MKKGINLLISTMILVLTLNSILAAEASVNYCCEKTTNGAWCQNAAQDQCDSNFQLSPTSCESTSYCKAGCCFDSQEGLCMESTPQRVCSESNGTWSESAKCDIPQCNLGCCVLGDQGAFVTLTRCKAVSGFYGIETDFRKNIADELSCIAIAQGEDKGACVFEDPATATKTCKFETRKECKGASLVNDANSTNLSDASTIGITFYKDILCTAEDLGTNCGPSTKTTTVDGKDEVYFTDTCGNIANIYDADRYDDKQYWKKVYKKEESCGAGQSNANSKTCGNCDYFLGSIAKKTTSILGRPSYGDYICVDLNCKDHRHGESWCVTDSPSGEGLDTVGSRYFKEVCLNNEIITEPCADFRNEICIENDFGTFSEAACRTNRWQDCNQQLEQEDCENLDQRECLWVEGYYFSTVTGQVEKSVNNSEVDADEKTPEGLCVPYYPPGLTFWGSSKSGSSTFGATTPTFSATNSSKEGSYGTGYVDPSSTGTSAGTVCSAGNSKLTVKWERKDHPAVIPGLEGIIGEDRKGDWECIENCQYATGEDLTDAGIKQWALDMNNICYKLGDCGGYINWQGKYTEDGYAAYHNNERIAGSGGAKIIEKGKTATTPTTGGNTGTTGTSDVQNAAAAVNAVSGVTSANKGTGAVIRDWIKNIVT